MKRVRFSDTPKVHELPVEEPDTDDAPYKKLKTQDVDLNGELQTDVDPALAAVKRAARRRSSGNPDLDAEGELVDVEEAEEDFQHNDDAEDFGVPLEPFNMQREREEGHFNEVGNYVETKVDKESRDAWLDSLQGVQIDVNLVNKLGTQAKRLEASGDDDELDEEDKVVYKRRVAGMLEKGETVLAALRRLGGGTKRAGGRDARQGRNRRQKAGKAAGDEEGKGEGGQSSEGGGGETKAPQHGTGGGASSMSAENRSAFNRLTEFADSLLSNGEYNVYSMTREQLLESCGIKEEEEEKAGFQPSGSTAGPSGSAASWAGGVGDVGEPANAAIASILATVSGGFQTGAREDGEEGVAQGSGGGRMDEDGDMDMFGEEDEQEEKSGAKC